MKVSVIVPVYNTRQYLDKCLTSLVNQTLDEIEIIVINDGSKENVDDIVEKYKDRIVYVKNTNHGIGYTRNLGIKMAKGEYIGFVDSDDYVSKDMYLDYYNYAKTNDLDMVIADYYRVEKTSIKKMMIKHFEIGKTYTNKEIIVNIDYGPCNKLFKRNVIIDNNITFEENLKFEDMPFVAKALKHSKIGHIEKAYYNYIVRDESETTIIDNRSFDIFKILDIVNNYYKTDNLFSKELEFLSVSKLLNYNILQRDQISAKARNNFIDKTFDYINNNFPNYKNNSYWNNEPFFKKILKQNIVMTRIYILVYNIRKNLLKL